ncbi:LysR family transcriptional regulator [Hylemonella gracilis]|jgi:DNA-binding transcriptional LysR family regulator|uniref:LysR family transcriptional regulator n=1 Tax=Hylemonella gracilis TaxID=80880 RepID=A0A4P6UKF4_9BURK|nr:LysR family transcriptional regulator [Hylemonella gracilis]QBK04600.1 LysR family transcriptional regulator [Hylemonella gracilis]
MHTDPVLASRVGHLRLRDLLLLDHIADTGSLRRTAERLNVTQPAITQALQGLEAAFGVALVERQARGATLTSAGQAALQRLRAARHELLAAQAAAQMSAHPTLHVGCVPVAALRFMPPALAALQRDAPHIRVELHEATVAPLWQALRAGSLDAILCRLPPPDQQELMLDDADVHLVGDEHFAFVVGPGHRAARGRQTLRSLAGQAWALPARASLTRRAFDQLYLDAGLAPPTPAVTSVSFHTNLHLAATGRFITVAPQSVLLRYVSALGLTPLRVPAPRGAGRLAWVVRASRRHDPLLVALTACIIEAAKGGA